MKLKAFVTIFLTFAAMIGGSTMAFFGLYMMCILNRFNDYYYHYMNDLIVGVLLLSGGLASLWVKSRFYRDNSNRQAK